MGLPGKHQLSCVLPFTIKDTSGPLGSQAASHAETHKFTEVTVSLTLRGFFFCLFSVPAVQLRMFCCPSCSAESQPGDAVTRRGVYRTALGTSTFFHPSLMASLFARTPLPTAEQLSSSSAHLQVSDQKPEDALRSKRDSGGDY